MRYTTFFIAFIAFALLTACGSPAANNSTVNSANNSATAPAKQTLAVSERPQSIKDMMAARGEQDTASPKLEIEAPVEGSTVESSTVNVMLKLSGDLKGYKPGKDAATGMGNHIHVILDNQPYEAFYNIDGMFELRNVTDGEHTLRVFPSRPWHESYKDDGAFQMVKFTVKNGSADASKPTTTNSGEKMANSNSEPKAEGKDMAASTAGAVDAKKPLLTYSRPKGEYKGADADAIMLDFWLTNAKLTGDGGDYRVSYSVDGGEPKFIEKWEPIWLTGWTNGKHSVKLELVDKDGKVVDNGGYNTTTREITITK